MNMSFFNTINSSLFGRLFNIVPKNNTKTNTKKTKTKRVRRNRKPPMHPDTPVMVKVEQGYVIDEEKRLNAMKRELELNKRRREVAARKNVEMRSRNFDYLRMLENRKSDSSYRKAECYKFRPNNYIQPIYVIDHSNKGIAVKM